MPTESRSRFLKPFGPWWWLTGSSPQGNGTRLGPFNSEGEAWERANQANLSSVQLFKLNTRDPSVAVGQIRYQQMQKGAPVDDVLKRMRRSADSPGESENPVFRRQAFSQNSGKMGGDRLEFDEDE